MKVQLKLGMGENLGYIWQEFVDVRECAATWFRQYTVRKRL